MIALIVNVNIHRNPAMYIKLIDVLINLFMFFIYISETIYIYIIHSESYLACEKMECIVSSADGKRKKFGGNYGD